MTLPAGWSRTTAHCISHIEGRLVIERLQRPDGGMNYVLHDDLEMQIAAVRQSAEKAIEVASNWLGEG